MEEKFKIKDESGDKDFFTIIPNFIINHSIAVDRALYLEMKRFAGEDGECFATEKTIMRRLQIGKKAFNKSLSYLILRGWVTFIGLTKGKTRPIKTYKINNIWQENSEYYKKISPRSTLSSKEEISAESNGDKSPKHTKISAESTIEEDPTLRRSIEEDIIIATPSVADPVNKIFDIFYKTINPTLNFGNKTQRSGAEELIKKFGEDKTIKIAEYAVSVQGKKFAPTITTPHQLKEKIGDLMVYAKRQKENVPSIAKIR